MNQGKAITLAAVLKLDRPFKNATLKHMTGLNPSLTRYHLDQWVLEGSVEKNGMYYAVIDKDKLLEHLVSLDDHPALTKAKKTAMFTAASKWNEVADEVVAMRILQMPLHNEIRHDLNNVIDETISTLKNLRKYVNGKTITQKKALKIIQDKEDHIYEVFSDVIDPSMPRSKFVEEFELQYNDMRG